MEVFAAGERDGVAQREAPLTGRERSFDLTSFVEEHYERLIRLAALVCNDASDAQEAVQNGLERAWRKRSQLRENTSVRSWVDRIVVREAIRLSSRRRAWRLRAAGDLSTVEAVDERLGPPTVAALRIAYSSLTPPQRAAIALHHYLGYSVTETAVLVGVPMETVRSRLRQARLRMRDCLEVAAK